jgi:hypothetical protein
LIPRVLIPLLLVAVGTGVYVTGGLGSKDAEAGDGIYVAQSGAGSESGRGGCGNAHPLAWLNAAGSWGRGAGRVQAGGTVDLCGTLTQPIAIAQSGAPGAPITLRFMPGAAIRLPACPAVTGCIDTAGHRYVTIEGAGAAAHGTIEDTEQGTGRKHESSVGIQAANCTGCTFRYLTIANLYVHTAVSDSAVEGSEVRGINFSGSDVTIAHNTLHDIGWALLAEWNRSDGNDRIEANTIYHIDHGFASTADFSGGSIGPLYVDHNHIYGYANWDTEADSYHHDGIHCFSADSVGYEPHYNGFYIYDNRFGGGTGRDMTGQIFLEGTPDKTPCGDRTSNVWIFNNVALDTSTTTFTNGIFGIFSTEAHVYNNTLIGQPTPENTCYSSNSAALDERFANNLLSTCSTLISVSTGPRIFAHGGLNHNLYAGGRGQSNSFVCGESGYFPFTALARWQRCMAGDGASRTAADARIRTGGGDVGALQSHSSARRAGINLSSLCAGPTQPLCANIDGRPRPRTGAWDAGAY